jgi:hypothetical protein
MKIDASEPIVEDGSDTREPDLQQLKPRSWLCAIKFHRRTHWSKPYMRKGMPIFAAMFMSSSAVREVDCYYQARECRGCGEREERSI